MSPEKFSAKLLYWSEENRRPLPWKETKDPYKIWISEIILQQTRVHQGTPYYLRFIHRFPDIKTLAKASEDDVLKIWEGLGYYSRARNIYKTAKFLTEYHDGIFPSNHDQLLKLKGIGPYTAAAMSSFAFGLRNAVVDGNVIRLISRILGINQPVESKETYKTIHNFVHSSIQFADPALFNQALMDFGSAVCIPKNPSCDVCPYQKYCVAHQTDQIKLIPFKSKKPLKKIRYFHYFDLRIADNFTVFVQRCDEDIWKNLYEYPGIETDSDVIPNEENIDKRIRMIFPFSVSGNYVVHKNLVLKQELTHRKIVAVFYLVYINQATIKINKGHYLVERKKVPNFAFPKIITEYLKKVDS